MSEVDKLATVLGERFSHVNLRADYGWPCPPLNVIDCVLSLNRRYKSFVLPRVNNFAKHHAAIVELKHLHELMKRHNSLVEFSRAELNYNDANRAKILWDVIEYMLNIQHKYEGKDEYERLRKWAVQSSPKTLFRLV